MMQALFETIFDVLYLGGVIAVGVLLVVRSGAGSLARRFGVMALVLGVGDAFHLVPRIWALWTDGLAAHAVALGVGKLITSITMTVFYLILYFIWRQRYGISGRRPLTVFVCLLAAARVALCLFPQNAWLSADQPLAWGIWRNVPFAILGLLLIVLFWQESRRVGDPVFRHMPLAIALSFAFYLPVVLLADRYPLLGMLMIPKTLAYVWIVAMGWRLQAIKKPQIF